MFSMEFITETYSAAKIIKTLNVWKIPSPHCLNDFFFFMYGLSYSDYWRRWRNNSFKKFNLQIYE